MNPKRGELYLLKPASDGKRRPVVIVSRNQLNGGHSVVAIPFYSQRLDKRSKQTWCALFRAGEGGLEKDCVAKADEIALIDKLDIDLAGGAIGRFDDAQMERLLDALRWTLLLK